MRLIPYIHADSCTEAVLVVAHDLAGLSYGGTRQLLEAWEPVESI